MKKKWLVLFAVIFTSIIFNACNKSNSVSPAINTGTNAAYFPNKDGNYYVYSIHSTDSTGGTITGTRSATYSGSAVINGITYQQEIDTVAFGLATQVNPSFFLVSGDTVFFALDTTGMYKLIPDSIKPYISFDTKLKAYDLSFTSGSSWDVFSLGLIFSPSKFISVTATYQGTEQITLNLTSGQSTQTARVINYTLKLSIPGQTPAQYSATAWLVQNIGVVKWQGSGAVFSAFSGGGVNLADSTTTVAETLLSYSVK